MSDRFLKWCTYGIIFLIIGVFGLVVYGVYEEIAKPSIPKTGIITNKHHHDSYYIPVTTMVGKVPVTNMVYCSESFTVEVTEGTTKVDVTVTSNYWNSVQIGDKWYLQRN